MKVESISKDEQIAVANQMQLYGGSFAAKLGEALIYADQSNAQKIKETWPELWKTGHDVEGKGDDGIAGSAIDMMLEGKASELGALIDRHDELMAMRGPGIDGQERMTPANLMTQCKKLGLDDLGSQNTGIDGKAIRAARKETE